jgi:hypothetical protein
MSGLLFLSELLSNKVFLQKLLTSTTEQEEMEKLYLALLEQTLTFISSATIEQNKQQDDQGSISKLWKCKMLLSFIYFFSSSKLTLPLDFLDFSLIFP